MLLYRIPLVLLLSLFVVLPVRSQEEKLKVVDGQIVITPEIIERDKRRSERLQNPTFIKLSIASLSHCQDEGSKKISGCYKAPGKIAIELFMTNTSSETINIAINTPYFEYEVQLSRDGKLVPYRKDITEKIGQPPTAIYRNLLVRLEPGKKEKVDVLYLEMWYGTLGPGHYQLDIKRRFEPGGGLTDTASATFEVAP